MDHYPIHGPARLALNGRKMWVDFRILENPSSRRTVFLWSRHLLFVVILYRGKPSKNKKTPNDSSMEKAVCEN